MHERSEPGSVDEQIVGQGGIRRAVLCYPWHSLAASRLFQPVLFVSVTVRSVGQAEDGCVRDGEADGDEVPQAER